MWRNKYGDLIEEWKVGMIVARAKRYGFRDDEIPDLEQMIVPELLNANFNRELRDGATETTFVIAIIDRHLQKVLRDRSRDKRRVNYEASPLPSAEVITERDFFSLRETERIRLRIDLETIMAGLSPEEKQICAGLIRGETQTEIAGAMGKSKAAVSNAVRRLREKFQKWGLDTYL